MVNANTITLAVLVTSIGIGHPIHLSDYKRYVLVLSLAETMRSNILKKTLVSKGLHINMICALCGKFLNGLDRKAHLDTDHSLDPNLIEWIVQFDDRLSKLEPPDATNRASTFYTGKGGNMRE